MQEHDVGDPRRPGPAADVGIGIAELRRKGPPVVVRLLQRLLLQRRRQGRRLQQGVVTVYRRRLGPGMVSFPVVIGYVHHELLAIGAGQHDLFVHVADVVAVGGGQGLAAEPVHGRSVIQEAVAGQLVVDVEAVVVLQGEIVVDVGPRNPVLERLAVVAGRGVAQVVRRGEDGIDVAPGRLLPFGGMRVVRQHVRGQRQDRAVPGHGFRLGIEFDPRPRLFAGDEVGMVDDHFRHALLHVGFEPVPDKPGRRRHFRHPPGRLPGVVEAVVFAESGDEFPYELGRLSAASFPQLVRPLTGQRRQNGRAVRALGDVSPVLRAASGNGKRSVFRREHVPFGALQIEVDDRFASIGQLAIPFRQRGQVQRLHVEPGGRLGGRLDGWLGRSRHVVRRGCNG